MSRNTARRARPQSHDDSRNKDIRDNIVSALLSSRQFPDRAYILFLVYLVINPIIKIIIPCSFYLRLFGLGKLFLDELIKKRFSGFLSFFSSLLVFSCILPGYWDFIAIFVNITIINCFASKIIPIKVFFYPGKKFINYKLISIIPFYFRSVVFR